MSDHDHEKCCDGCDKAMQGVQGPQGVQGAVGPAGQQGPQGVAGPQGIQGACVNCYNVMPTPPATQQAQFAEFFSIANQTLAPSTLANQPGQAVMLENTVYATSGIDGSQVAVNGKITVNVSGWYDIAAGMTGTLNPIPSPLPVWTLSLFKNGNIVPGSTFSNIPLSPAQQSNEITADTFVHLNKGDVLTLANTSTAPVLLSAPILGTNAQTNSAYLKLQLLQPDTSTTSPFVDAANASFVTSLDASQQGYAASTAVNLSQLPADALTAQNAANNLVTMLNIANVALLAAQATSTPASYAASLAAWNSAMSAAALSVTAANIVVSTLNPATTTALVAQSSLTQTATALLAATPLIAI
jgi:hypothetical protein